MTAADRLRRRAGAVRASALRRLGVAAPTPGMLTIVVAVTDAHDYLDECLQSLRAQDHGHYEVLVIDAGAGPEAIEVARVHAGQERRVRILAQQARVRAEARVVGLEAARGEFITFMDPDDRVTRHGYALALASLRRTGSDVAVFDSCVLRRGATLPVDGLRRREYRDPAVATTLLDRPEAMSNLEPGARVHRTASLAANGIRETGPGGYDDAGVIRGLARCRSIDVLTHLGHERRADDERSPLTARVSTGAGLEAFTGALDASVEELRTAGLDALTGYRVIHALALEMPRFTARLADGDDEFGTRVRAEVTRLLGLVDPEEYAAVVPAHEKTLQALLVEDVEEAARFLREVHPDPHRHATTVEGSTVVLTEGSGGPGDSGGPDSAGVPASCRRLAESQTEVLAEVSRGGWTDDGLTLSGFAVIDNVDLAGQTPRITLFALAADGRRCALDTTVRPDPVADRQLGHRHADLTNGGFDAVLAASALPAQDAQGTRSTQGSHDTAWTLHAEVSVRGLSRTGPVTATPWAFAALRRARAGSDRVWTVVTDDRGCLGLCAEARRWRCAAARAGDGVIEVDIDGSGAATAILQPRRAGATPLRGRRVATPTGCRMVFDSAALQADAEYRLLVRPRLGRWSPVAHTSAPVAAEGSGERIGPDLAGHTVVLGARLAGELVAVDLLEEELVVIARLPVAGGEWIPVLLNGSDEVTGGLERMDDGQCRLRFGLVREMWGRSGLCLPSGRWEVALREPETLRVFHPPAAPGLAARLPTEVLQPRMRLRAEVCFPDRPRVRLVVAPPLRDDELGERNQRLLREAADVEQADLPAVFLRSMFGEHADGNALGIHQELVRRGAPLTSYWSVRDHSVAVPRAGVPVIERSREWHEAASRSRYHVADVHQFEGFRKPLGQTLIQTMHGYPYKLMGHDWWRKLGLAAHEIESLDRRTRDWDVLVSPAKYATPLLRRAFLEPAGADAAVLETGYPRNDALLRREADLARRNTRALLGLTDDTVAVLYAPTFRDYLSSDDRTAQLATFFDPVEAARLLPTNYVVLMRGHAYNARLGRGTTEVHDQLRDVSGYPDVNDLILASDVAVLDYSSLRFDYAVTGQPMIFCVPDLAQYDRFRGGVIPFDPTAPGPHVAGTLEAVRCLIDLYRLVGEDAAARAQFRVDYVELEDGFSAARLVDAVMMPEEDVPV